MEVPADKVLEELFKARFTQLRADSEYATQAISQTVRLAALGLTGLMLPYATAEPGKLSLLLSQHSGAIVFCAGMGAAGIIADIAQNGLSDAISRSEMKRLEKNLKDGRLTITSPSQFMLASLDWKTNARSVAYYAKIGFVSVGLLVLLVVLSATMNL